MTNHDEGKGCHHNTAIEEAMHRIELTLQAMANEITLCKWWEIKKKASMQGMIVAFGMVLNVLYALNDKYNNTHGGLN